MKNLPGINRRFIHLVFAVLFLMGVVYIQPVYAKEPSGGIAQSYSVKDGPAVAAAATVPSSAETAERLYQRQQLKERIQDSRVQPQNMVSQGITPRADQNLRASKTIKLEAEVRLHPDTLTPRQVKGDNIEPAVVSDEPAEVRDEQTAMNFLKSMRNVLKIENPEAELELRRYSTDRLDHRHLRYSQKYNGLRVWPSELIVHLDAEGNVDMMDGVYTPTPRKMVVTPVVDSEKAVALARQNVAGDNAVLIDSPELIVFSSDKRRSSLGWKMELASSPAYRWLVVVDAHNGKILMAYNQNPSQNQSGSGVDLFGITRNLNVWYEGGTFYMVDTSKSMFNSGASDPPNPNRTVGGIIVLDARNQPPTSEVDSIPQVSSVTSSSSMGNWLADAVSAAYSLSETYDYFRERHNRNSIDGNGGSITSVVRLGSGFENAFWDSGGKRIYFGDGDDFAGALDVVAHELTHGVTSYEANLIYQNQPGALNEAFSDIFGEMVEAYSTGATDWIMGTNLSGQMRSLKSPSDFIVVSGLRYPSKMSEYLYPDNDYLDLFVDRDYGGVHINCTIIEHAFYLLAEGLSGAIGNEDAAKIFYRALAYHLVMNSQFVDARLACIASAEELFGANSTQAKKTAEAFDAVEISDTDPTPPPSDTPPASGDDSILFVYYEPQVQAYFLGRYQKNDPGAGVRLSVNPVKQMRPSVSEDGSFAVYVNTQNDLCFIGTDGASSEECMGWYDVYSASMSHDAEFFGFVFLDATGNPGNTISVFDLEEGSKTPVREFTLVAPAIDGEATHTILQADFMNFTSDHQYIVYDAFNVIEYEDGSDLGAWSIYAIDLETEQTLVLVPPIYGFNIANPALAQTNDYYVVFDAYQGDTDTSTIYALNMNSGKMKALAEVQGDFGVPCYNGDDSAVIYSAPDNTTTGYSLWKQAVAGDRVTPSGSPGLYFQDADFAAIYRYAGSGDDGGDDDDGGGDNVQDDGGGGCFIRATDRLFYR